MQSYLHWNTSEQFLNSTSAHIG